MQKWSIVSAAPANTPLRKNSSVISSCKKKILDMDRNRAQYYRLYTGKEWGDKENYDLCLNTSGIEIVTLADWVAQIAKEW